MNDCLNDLKNVVLADIIEKVQDIVEEELVDKAHDDDPGVEDKNAKAVR
jgi:hypothetical protein